jgi:predicted small lipoprotein YifL
VQVRIALAIWYGGSRELGRNALGRSGVGIQVTSKVASRLAWAAAVVAALALSGCGRKGMLDPPPTAGAPPAPQAYSSQPSLGEDTTFQPPGGARTPRAQAAAPPAGTTQPPKTFFLDFLLGGSGSGSRNTTISPDPR